MDEPAALIDEIYEASFVPERWPELLDKFARLVDALGGYIFTVSRGASAWTASDSMAPHLKAFMEDGWVPINTRAPRAEALGHPGFISDLDVYTLEELETEPIYRDFLRPRGLGWACGTHIRLPTQDVLSINVERRLGRGPFERECVQLLDGFRPHLARAVMVGARLGLAQACAVADTLEALGLPAVLLGAHGQALALNKLVQSMIPDVVQDRTNRLTLVEPAADKLLQTSLSALELGQLHRAAIQSILLKGDHKNPPAIAHLVPITGSARDIFALVHSALIITPVAKAAMPAGDVLQALFDLTPAEQRVFTGIAAGRTLRQIAETGGTSYDTVRVQLKSIFAKAGVSRQAELVALSARLGSLAR
ncbi:helix-turn-helix transcriptional regulator [Mesorhizobium sp. BAC0120]|uniref:helix-turn-helix transcriptional regulator n=1 Tax=Mesorhizobium sp. BAC0120 TaxID=3090670 RepID=UPI00298C2FBC|nr:helix-turn-helix transcriptional regulator [Mesorhizobium sp. BAC0120]MDW6025172.1 helix-turn-helix transcriptional regulator [Mesorhizobium sp. BAC0120]